MFLIHADLVHLSPKLFFEVEFLGGRHGIPLSNNLGDDFRLSHTRELKLVPVVPLAAELSIYNTGDFSTIFRLHQLKLT